MINAGKYNRKIKIYSIKNEKDKEGFKTEIKELVLEPFAYVKTTRGFTLIQNDSNFEKAYTNFTIRFPKTRINRDMLIEFNGTMYSIEYLNNIDEKGIELEIQAKAVVH